MHIRRSFVRVAGLLVALGASGSLSAAQTIVVPPEPPTHGSLGAVGAWISQWLPVVGAASYPAIEETGDFLGRASDSVTAALLQGCTLVLQQRSLSVARTGTVERLMTIRVPLEQVDTSAVRPRIRRPGMLLERPTVMVTGRLVVPLRHASRARFITVLSESEPQADSLASEHLVPFAFAIVPATRSADALRRAAAMCGERSRPRERVPRLEPVTAFGF